MFHGINDINLDNRFGTLFHIGRLPVTLYGFLVVLGFIIAVIFCAIKLSKFYKVSYDPLLKFAVVAFPIGIVFASIWSYAIGNSNAWYAGFTGNGGLAIQGGVVASTLLGLFWFPLSMRNPKYWVNVPLGKQAEAEAVRRVSTWIFFDAIVPVVLIGQAVGRWGNFFNYEVFGQAVGNLTYAQALEAIKTGNTEILPLNWLRHAMPGVWTNMWIASIPNPGGAANPDPAWMNAARFHQPLFLYESFFNVIFFTLIYSGFINMIPKFKAGMIGGLAITYTGLFRVATERLRFSAGGTSFSFNQSFVLSILLVVLGTLIISYAFLVAGNRKIRHVHWFGYSADWMKIQAYQLPWFRDLALKYGHFQDNFLKTSLTTKISQDIQRLKSLDTVRLTDYVLTPSQTKFYGSRYVTYFKHDIWIEN
ncbi:phosphatidylglycerol:prolipoprotein diacylglycerol transferase [Mycoplasmoides fastidiosum]|uniref:Phosphatidylglycerol--prolipoprotein diacylglyceryl transferase n=1 Tax=Mycoplasmoides fastidiosum TaxID=92758 RepID=A0ABU0LY04_9BACT|nr:prolipoprotein diacylglyceryl transferase [Mycoplasmoides fastidiosum]MDQ0513569.1 phosphatidylglycerol:prolipoprotein diacylglycerol transferase [Mycoplasmoides fastidiosum]UUD38008.1 prolipoprotein diacylglyceryl transferase [Mycoplasmoides fastidiosum]